MSKFLSCLLSVLFMFLLIQIRVTLIRRLSVSVFAGLFLMCYVCHPVTKSTDHLKVLFDAFVFCPCCRKFNSVKTCFILIPVK